MDKQSALSPSLPQVPPIVLQAIEHLQSYGLHVLGIFRVGGSKKRMKQMREEKYFRDLPEPLLTRDLYSAFLETQTFDNPNMQITALRLLCCLLPIPNRDTLKVLLEFLAEVAQCAEDSIDDKGNEVKGQHHDFLVEDKARADERKEIIDVVQDMIEHHGQLFEISAEMHHDALLQLLDSEPEIVDYILRGSYCELTVQGKNCDGI
ncbi:Rho GTPase-activating protein 6 [Desmophyllum pertusum]|uniref:Rho GTPase-activating protein 6 n=1 Tax=Desmophyllum pertusum TaxID=174260 RepID=A0A9W9YKZ3_9CNID|nr:Rho GTPase-activating protein 6 [Desmophyllum pertusum]